MQICFFIYIKALFFIITRKSLPFEVTPKSGSSEETILRFKKILPILIVIGLLGFSLTIYAIRIVTGETSVVAGFDKHTLVAPCLSPCCLRY